MPEGALSGEVREAVEEIQAYLSDQVPPLLALDSAHVLLAHTPELGAEVVRAWVAGQMRAPGGGVTSTDLLFHAIKKLQHFGKLKLIEREPLSQYLDGVAGILIAQAPELEREALRTYLLQAAESETSLAAQVQVLHRAPGAAVPAVAAAATPSAAVSAEIAASMRQFALLMSRLTAGSEKVGGADPQRQAALTEQAPQIVAAAAQSATSQTELEQHLLSLSRAGLMSNVRLNELFMTLSRGLPNWSLAEGTTHESPPLQAMHKIVSLAPDPARAAGHFRELLNTIAKQFNEKSLPRAVQVVDVARRLLSEGKIDKASADLMLGTAHDELDHGELMAQTQNAGNLPLLHRLLNFYPALTPVGLLAMLDNEPDRARRRLWIALLEAHGIPGRAAALDRLERSFQDPTPGDHGYFLQRNFVYLLHRIKPIPGEDPQREIRLCVRCADISLPAPLVREALINLGQRRHPEAESALRQKLEQLERALETPTATIPHDAVELRRMLSLVIGGLARQMTGSSRRAVVDHGLKQKPALGDTLERLGELGGFDLAEDPDTTDKLLAALRTLTPMKVLGLSIRRNEVGPVHVVRALYSTRTEDVRRAFEDLASRFPDEAFGETAAAALAAWNTTPAPPTAPPSDAPAFAPAPAAAPTAPAAGLAGDLEVFGLPELLQTLSQTETTGRLLLRDRAGQAMAEIILRKGFVRDARARRQLPMPEAFYQVLESPQPGTFEFTRQPIESVPDGQVRDVMGLMMEGMRRYDEFQRARVIAPDHVLLYPTGGRPTAPEHETDGVFIRDLWVRMKDGATPRQCEDAVSSDSYRIRTLLAHWLTEGTLATREGAPP